MFVISFLVYVDKKVHKKLKKKIKRAKKFQTLDFAESNAHRKTNARGSFETYDLFFLALYLGIIVSGKQVWNGSTACSCFPCFRETVVVTCKIGSFLCSLDNLLQKNVIVFFFENQISKWRLFEKGLYLTYSSHFLVTREKLQKFL